MTALKSKEDKNFFVTVNNKTYRLRYEITEQGMADIFLLPDDFDNINIAAPRLQLNLGAFLLPDALSFDTIKSTNPSVVNHSVIEFDTNEVSEEDLTDLKEYIKSVGLKNILKNF